MPKAVRGSKPCSRRSVWAAVALSSCVAIALLPAPRPAYVPTPRRAAAAASPTGRRRELVNGLLAAGAAAPGLAQPADAAEGGASLANLYLAWQKLAEGKNPLEALAPGTRRRLRSISRDLDSLQNDVFNRDYATVLKYKKALQLYVPLFTDYTDNTFPGDTPAGRASRVAMRYEVGKFFTSLDRLNTAAKKEDYDPMVKAFADMALAFDRYVKAGNLYDGADPIVSTDIFYQGAANELKFESPVVTPPQIKDRILVLSGPDKGRTGIMIGKELGPDGDKEKPLSAFVKFDGGIGEGADKLQEIKLVPYKDVAKQSE